jgi:hypothetical protein
MKSRRARKALSQKILVWRWHDVVEDGKIHCRTCGELHTSPSTIAKGPIFCACETCTDREKEAQYPGIDKVDPGDTNQNTIHDDDLLDNVPGSVT